MAASLRMTRVDAYGPSVTVAGWNETDQCIRSERWTYSIEDLVKQTLPVEWQGGAGHPPGSLRAGASIIRQDYWFFYRNPEGGLPFCFDVTPYFYHVRRSQLAGFVEGSAAFDTAAATDDTVTKGWAPYGSGRRTASS